MNKKSIKDIDLKGKKVFLRCDFNVPLDMETKTQITDDRRIVESLPTIKYLLDNNAKVILASHIGKNKDGLSLAPVAKRLSELLNMPVIFAKDIVGEDSKIKANNLNEGEVMLLENVRLDVREEQNDPEFAKELASLAEVYVLDAFGTAHRAHASTEGIAHYLPAVCGFLIEKELEILGKAINEPQRPLMAIIGGSKVSTKIGVITNLLDKVDTLAIGGGMTYTFMKALGGNVGMSICEKDKLDLALEILEKAKQKGVKFLIPSDSLAGKEFKNDTETKVFASNNIPDDYEGMDIGPDSIKVFEEEILKHKTIIWNGPVGVFEFDTFAKGTKAVAEILVKATKENGAISIIGGGDSAAAAEKFGLADEMTHISTGGGASLELMEGKQLPGIVALMDK